jgi:hypothetical protein
MADVGNIIRGLTAAQRAALASVGATPLGNMWLRGCAGSTKSALVNKGLATGYGEWCTLTPLGKSVREAL